MNTPRRMKVIGALGRLIVKAMSESNSNCVIMASKQSLMENLIQDTVNEVDSYIEELSPTKIWRVNKSSIVFDNGSRILALPPNEKSRGISLSMLFIVDYHRFTVDEMEFVNTVTMPQMCKHSEVIK